MSRRKRIDVWTPREGETPRGESTTFDADQLRRQRPVATPLRRRVAAGCTAIRCHCSDARIVAAVEPPPSTSHPWRVYVLPNGHGRRLDLEDNGHPIETACRCGLRWTLDRHLLAQVARQGRKRVDAGSVAID